MSSRAGPDDALGFVGSTIDQVRFDACVDAGGFGLIYRGYHEGLGETVAIKCLRIATILRTNEEIREALAGRFRDETRLLYRLSQGNLDIVRCISSGTVIAPKTKEYTPYMVLEWLDGQTLSAELKERRAKRLPGRTLEEAVALLDPAVGGLAYAHAHEVVHRDVKPGNLFLTRTREGVRMKVLDFGLAKILSDESIGVRPSVETGIGVHFCSPSYGAPEQFSARAGKIGPWTDVYSLALVLLEVLTGDKVRPASSLADGLVKALAEATGSPSASSLGLHLPKGVEELLLRAVAQDPLARPKDAGVLWDALKAAMAAAPPPRPNLNMATVLDSNVGDAMNQVRAAAAGAKQASPFAGTMLMHNAPAGAPHLAPAASAFLPAPVPAAGRPPEGAGRTGTQPTAAPAVPRSTSPLPSPSLAAPAQSTESPSGARARGDQLKGTLPMGAVSPVRSAHGAAPPGPQPQQHAPGYPPLQHAPQHAAPQRQAPQQHAPQHQAAQGHRPPSQPPGPAGGEPHGASDSAPTVPMKSSAGLVVLAVACLVLAVIGAGFYLVRVRGH